jgi:hypothetical protein
VEQPLAVGQMVCACAARDDEENPVLERRNFHGERNILGKYGSLIEINYDKVQPMHLSVKGSSYLKTTVILSANASIAINCSESPHPSEPAHRYP